MKKTTKMMSTFALSTALAIGCALPAFAAGVGAVEDIEEQEGDTRTLESVVSSDDEGISLSGDTSSVITVSTFTSQISVTLPVALPIAVDTVGGPGMAPNNYGFKNNSVPNIQVTGASWAIEDAAKENWNLASAAFETPSADDEDASLLEAMKYNSKDGSELNKRTPKMGSLHLTLTPGTYAEGKWTTEANSSLDVAGSTATGTLKGASGELEWTIKGTEAVAADTTGATSNTQLIKVDPSSSIIAGQQNAPADVIKITYTVKLV